MRLSAERAGYCSFVEGVLYTRNNNIVEVQEFVEGLQELADKKRISQTQEKSLLLTAYEMPAAIGELQTRILEPLNEGKNIDFEAELLALRGNNIKKPEE